MSRSLGTLTIDVIAEVGGFASGLDKSERRAEKWRKKVEAEAKLAGLALGTAIAAAVVMIGRNTIAAEREVAQLDAIIRSTGGAAGYTRQQLLDMADTLSSKSTFSGGEIVEAQTRLLSYSGILTSNIPRAMQAVIDQSARLGISVSQSAETIGRALESPSKAAAALAQQGFGAAFTKEVRGTIDELVKAGKEGEAQVMILEILEESYAGAAQAARDTFGGALQALGNTLNDITTAKDGSLKGATDAVNTLIETLNDPATREGFNNLISGAVEAIGTMAKFASTAANVTKFVAESLAARVSGPDMADVVRVEDRIERLQKTLAAVQNSKGTLGFSMLNASELIPSDLVSRPDTVIQRLRGEIEMEQRKLAEGQRMLEQAAKAASAASPIPDGVTGDAAARAAAAAAAADADNAKARLAGQQQLQRAYESASLQLQRQIELFDTSADRSGRATELQRLNFEMAQGSLKGLNSASQERLRALATEIDRLAGVKSANEEAAKATEAFVKLKDELNKKDSLGVDLARDRLKVLQAAANVGAANDQDYAATAAKVIQQVGGSGAADYKGPDALYGGSSGEFAKIDSAQEAERQKFAAQLEALEENRQARFDLEAEWNAQELQLREEHEANLARLDRARWQVAATEAQSALGSITDVMRTSFGEQSALYKAAFVVQKAAAIAQSVIAIQQGMAMAAANPWPTNLAAIASVAAATAGIVSNIAAVGMAHDGIDSVPETGTWLLQKGERVTTAATSAKLDATLDRVSRDSAGGGRGDTNEFNFNVNGTISERERLMLEQTVTRAVTLARQDRVADTTSGTGPQSRAMRSNWNVRRKVG
ncbi:TPA: phage tail length tape measure family protein [Stenotrophomonas maltophilia]|uniref:Phage tail length tape measure family protein n=1 Tax=Stenotrophomonas maltophilia TaxID=40324 RepID=A0AAI9C1N2_STEMA|nr:phage tail length tape measure family protein [Stenotrophomonas maltophilia]HEL4101062.1 phage tail length tape measure family protein [Stenotrophomonas maltophilia]HEL5043480.1 phage tail length tape measure family protein [Stenotrophomonas maltophilia]